LFERLRRTPRTVLAVLAFFGLVMPAANSAPAAPPAPAVVSVAVTGNAHIPTDRILSVVKTKVGDPFDPAVVQQDLRAIADLGFFADQAPPIIKQRRAIWCRRSCRTPARPSASASPAPRVSANPPPSTRWECS